jgi:magnesium transporter
VLTVRCARSGNQVEQISLDAAPDLLARSDTVFWFDLDTPSEKDLEFLERQLKIHHLTLEDVVKQNQRPKIESFENYVYMVIHPLIR